LNASEQRRVVVLNQLESGALVTREAGQLLGLSERQVRRMRSRYREQGAVALVHGNRGRPAHNAVSEETEQRVLELARTTYQGFNQQHLTEMLAEQENIDLSRPTVRRILSAAGISAPRRRRPPRHRRRRDRYAQEGMLLQMDASRHDWLEGRGPDLSLVGGIDDATGKVPWACFREQEDAHGYFQVMRKTVLKLGIPMAVYADRHSIFFQTKDKQLSIEEELAGHRQPTQFGRLLEELGVQLILALSPQAKGRIERLWGTFQDRLTSELRLVGAKDPEQANQVLWRYLPRHNRRFTVLARDATPAWLPWPKDRHLDDFFCFKYRRVVLNDNTVRFGARVIDIPPAPDRASLAHARVEVHERFDGSLVVHYLGRCIAKQLLVEPKTVYRVGDHSDAAELPPVISLTQSKPLPIAPDQVARRPAKHPWRTYVSRSGQNR